MNPQQPRYERWPGEAAGMPAPPSIPTAPTPLGPAPHQRRRRVIAALAGVLIGVGVVGSWLGSNGPIATTLGASGPASVKATTSAVVNIDTFATPFGASRQVPLGAGTGMILTPSGQVLTNNHVVQGASRISVSISGRADPVAATVVGVDPKDDVALIQLAGVSGLPTISVGSSQSLSVGDKLTAIGNALGKGGAPTVTTGTVSALHRSITAGDPAGSSSERLSDVIVTNAPIVPGDSGGALTDSSGRVVGMITAGNATTSGNAPHVGFAIPVDHALQIVQQMRSGSGSDSILLGDRAFLGVAVRPLDASVAGRFGVQSGVAVIGVNQGGPAAQVGMTAPAVITQIDGHPVTNLADLGTLIHAHTPGEKVSISWVDAQGTHESVATSTTGPAV